VSTADVQAASPFYGMQPSPEEVPKIRASMLIHYAEDDQRINAGIPAFEAALKKAKVDYVIHLYKGAQHAFFNDTSPRYNEAASVLAWRRTIDFFDEKLKT
jgi:carboxymethylenebutenolidase